MSTQTTISRPAKFVEDIGTDLAKQAVGMTGVPVVSGGIGSLTKATGETAAGFKARQDAARAFEVRQQNLAGLAPKVAAQDALQRQAQGLATSGVGSFQPFLTAAQQQAGAAGSTLGGVSLGAPTAAQTQSFMSPYQSQVMEASLAEFDRNKAIQEQGLRDQAVASGAFGGGREGVAMAEYDKSSDMNRAQLQASLLNQGFNQAMGARQQDIANRFGLGQAQQGLGGFQAGLGSQLQTQQGTDISRLGSLGALNQAQTQAGLEATRQANQMAAYQPQEQIQNYANIVTGIMGGMAGQGSTQTQVPNPSPLQTALGAAATGAGIYGALK
tara:strand:+ start:1757 stop:2740 length:984 start_codon:yes stop_codon:yes gene_type:complete